jgi:hypothetical protein
MVVGLASLSFSTHFNATEEPILALSDSPSNAIPLAPSFFSLAAYVTNLLCPISPLFGTAWTR